MNHLVNMKQLQKDHVALPEAVVETATPHHMDSDAVMKTIANKPNHIAIIMDGNNRYGKREGLAVGQGHAVGKEQLDPIVEFCRRHDIPALTVFAFSSENWQRPAAEVDLLMRLFEEAIHEQLPRMIEHDIRMRFIGNRADLSEKIQALMQEAEEVTQDFKGMTLTIAVSYGGRWDIVNAAKSLAKQAVSQRLDEEDIDMFDEATFHAQTQLASLPDVDLLIRTGGEYRISNFLLWQAAYAELYFTETLWPDFDESELTKAIEFYAARERRFGKTSEQVQT